MSIDDILATGRATWGDKPMSLPHIGLAAEVTAGDLARQARNNLEGHRADEQELKKELGNLITSAIRWCDDLGFDPQECITIAQTAQGTYAKNHPPKW